MKITSLTQQKKNPNRYNLEIDGEFKKGISDTMVLDFNLRKGKEITNEELRKVITSEDKNKVKDKALELLGRRLHSRRELEIKLIKKDYSEEQIQSTLDELEKEKYLDDLEFAKELVKLRQEKTPKGSIYLKKELYQKGIPEEMIEKVIAEEYPLDREIEVAEVVLKKKAKLLRNLEFRKRQEKLKQFLLQRGFQFEVINEIVNNSN
ncbi:RecX family transcriptional regulator [Patescibacteria group bacterium]